MDKLKPGEKVKCTKKYKGHYFTPGKEYEVYDHDTENRIVNCYDDDNFVSELKESECESFNDVEKYPWGKW